ASMSCCAISTSPGSVPLVTTRAGLPPAIQAAAVTLESWPPERCTTGVSTAIEPQFDVESLMESATACMPGSTSRYPNHSSGVEYVWRRTPPSASTDTTSEAPSRVTCSIGELFSGQNPTCACTSQP